MLGWLGIAAARLGMLLTAAVQVRVWARRADSIDDPRLWQMLDECRERMRVTKLVDLRNSEACSTPLVVGFRQPTILLPSAVLERLDEAELRSVFIHELNHVKRWDGVVNVLQGVLGAIYFFHPLVWLANNHIRKLREDACDELTVAQLDG
jgi:beta-lactamase regulating signal transducer with metallopeptidase domain